MTAAILVVVGSVALGAGLALLPAAGSRALAPIRAFALAASLAVVLGHLLPEGYEALGWWTVPLLLLGMAAPRYLARVLSARDASAAPCSPAGTCAAGLEAGYVGLLVHRVGDGLALAAVSETLASAAVPALVLVAIGAHAVPVVALVTINYSVLRGRRFALVRATWLAVAGLVGVAAASAVPFESVAAADGVVSAVVGGLLLHVVGHDVRGLVRRHGEGRGLNLVAAVVGLGLGVVSALVH